MARSNKYAAINFNEIYGPKKATPSSHSTPHSPLLSSQNTPPRPHGRMLVLTRPSQPQPQPQPTPPPKPLSDPPRPEPDAISLRPLGRTADSTTFPSSASLPSPTPSTTAAPSKDEKQPSPLISLHKPEPFVPPHLRPGFVGREEKLQLDGQRERQGFRAREKHAREHSPPRRDDGRPRSSGHEGMLQQQVGGSDLYGYRPSSGGNRPRSSWRNGSSSSSYRSHPF